MRHLVLTTATLALLATGAQSATITTIPDEDSAILPWGLPDTAAFGQTFTLASGGTVNDVTFRINDFGTSISFLAYLFAWDGTKTSGAALSSVAGTTAGSVARTGVTVSLGNVLVAAGQYVAFFQATSNGFAEWGSAPNTSYAGVDFVFQNNGGDGSQFGTTDWENPGIDLAFAIRYDEAVAPIPLPAGLPLLAAGLGMMGLVARRRKG